MKTTIAIFSPSQNAYSETFIRAHKSLPFKVKFYFDGWLPSKLEQGLDLHRSKFLKKIQSKVSRRFSVFEIALLESLKKEKVQCILAEYALSACATLNVVEYLRIPLVVHFHGFDASIKSVIDEYKDQYAKVFKYASSIIVVSTRMKADLLALGCPEEKIVVSCYGPDNEFQTGKANYKGSQSVAVGRFVDKKAPYLTILAFSKVVQQFPQAKLIMIGDGELSNTCHNLASVLSIANNIQFSGVQSPAQIRKIFSESIAFVQHSITAESGDSEGTPVAILEAQASGLPVISTYHAGIPDVVIHNKTGLLVEEKDIDGMSKNMVRILSENGLAESLGNAGKARIHTMFTMEKHLTEIAEAIRQSIK